jgi:hypothetical protein
VERLAVRRQSAEQARLSSRQARTTKSSYSTCSSSCAKAAVVRRSGSNDSYCESLVWMLRAGRFTWNVAARRRTAEQSRQWQARHAQRNRLLHGDSPRGGAVQRPATFKRLVLQLSRLDAAGMTSSLECLPRDADQLTDRCGPVRHFQRSSPGAKSGLLRSATFQ